MGFQEKNFQTLFNRWAKHFINFTSAFELKISKGKSLPYKNLEEHQLNTLYYAKHNKVIYKIPDAGFTNPFDSFVLYKTLAFVVVMFHAKQDFFYMIDIDDWINQRENSDRKSITIEEAKEIGIECSLKYGYVGIAPTGSQPSRQT